MVSASENHAMTQKNHQEQNREDVSGMNSSHYLEKLKGIYKTYQSRKLLSMLHSCVNCGMCAEACHYYCSENNPDYIPANRMKRLSAILSEYFHPIKSKVPLLKPQNPLENTKFVDLFKAAFENCTMCGKCALVCPMGINTGEAMYLARALLYGLGRLPSGLVGPVKTTLETGNYLGMSREDFVETIEWLSEEMEEDMGDRFSIPVDKENPEVIYIPHPLTLRDLPLLLMDEIKILEASGENYTLSTYDFDTVNYAFYQGSKESAFQIAKNTLDAREKLNAKRIVLAPCGHGYRVLKWEVEKMVGQRHAFPVHTFAERIDRYIKDGRLTLEKDKVEGPITYHDPCNIARHGGIIQEPRNILNALSTQFVEMHPNGVHNFCCGGGGGLASTGDYGNIRISMGKTKAEQIRKTGAKVVVTGCFNCKTQIRDLGKAYDLGIEVKSIVEVVADSILWRYNT